MYLSKKTCLSLSFGKLLKACLNTAFACCGGTFILLSLLTACGTKIPAEFDEKDELPCIYPDYVNVTIPVNMAPLTFHLDEEADGMVARYKAGEAEIICADQMQPDADDWHELIHSALLSVDSLVLSDVSPADKSQSTINNQQSTIQVDVYARHGDRWTHYRPFTITVSPDSIDPWLSFRLIPPSYVSYEALTISQRCLENYDERVIYDNMLCGLEKDGQCINCHSYQQYNPERMQFHARQNHGGTVIAYDGQLKKVNMKNDSIISAGVYPAWHPWLKLIAYSTNHTHQSFFTTSRDKIEVYDSMSDLIVYNIDTDEVMNIENRADELEVFPAWTPDGRTLYYCSAHFERTDSIEDAAADIVAHYDSLHYYIYRKSFDPETLQFGPRELVLSADSLLLSDVSPSDTIVTQDPTNVTQHSTLNTQRSALLPRISPDGRYLLFSVADHGVFHIWHHDADLWMMDLQQPLTAEGTTGDDANPRRLDEVNSPDTESYHSWSSNGRWIVFSSRRDDGTFTRPFFAHFNADGHFDKPFELPCADPDYHRQLMKSYNIPEFMRGPVTTAPQTFAAKLKGEGQPVKYVRQLTR